MYIYIYIYARQLGKAKSLTYVTYLLSAIPMSLWAQRLRSSPCSCIFANDQSFWFLFDANPNPSYPLPYPYTPYPYPLPPTPTLTPNANPSTGVHLHDTFIPTDLFFF